MSGKKIENQIVIQLKGGLGNQMFEYAFGRSLSIDNNVPLALDISFFDNQYTKDTPREFTLSPFNIQAEILSSDEAEQIRPKGIELFVLRVRNKLFPKNPYGHTPPGPNEIIGYHDNWHQNEMYFKHNRPAILKDFSLKKQLGSTASNIANTLTEKNAQEETTVSLHVRGGDYLNNEYAKNRHGVLSAEYYTQALEHISGQLPSGLNKLSVFVFTDDVAYFKTMKEDLSKLDVIKEIILVSGEKPTMTIHEEIHLMSLCKHNIIANSSFSWWGAWLNQNPDKIVIAPEKWLADTTVDTSGVCPQEWIRL